MSPEEEMRMKALELAVELRKRTANITGDLTVRTAKKFEAYIKWDQS